MTGAGGTVKNMQNFLGLQYTCTFFILSDHSNAVIGLDQTPFLL